MIDRAQVLHVAKLARLALSEDEVERMSRELSAVLDHIEKIGELELDGVAPTSHVIDVGERAARPTSRGRRCRATSRSRPRPSRSRRASACPSPGAS